MKKYKLPPSFRFFATGLFLLLCGYPLALQLSGMWEWAFFVAGIGLILVIYATVRQRFE